MLGNISPRSRIELYGLKPACSYVLFYTRHFRNAGLGFECVPGKAQKGARSESWPDYFSAFAMGLFLIMTRVGPFVFSGWLRPIRQFGAILLGMKKGE